MKSITTIAIDGPAASGKGTLAQSLAAHYDFACLHTGLLYRALALSVLRERGEAAAMADILETGRGMVWRDIAAGGEAELHRAHIGAYASELAQYAEVRALIIDHQRGFAAAPPLGKSGAILEGRDIGSVILPEADVKIFITASLAARAVRRQAQSGGDLAAIRDQLRARDQRDQSRAAAPLIQASDARLLNTTNLSIDETLNQAIHIIDDALAKRGNNN